MFSSVVQPGIVSLFSSTSSDPLGLFSSRIDEALPSDSFIHLLNDSTSQPAPPPPHELLSVPSIAASDDLDETSASAFPPRSGYALDQTVLHIQSPTLTTTFIRAPFDGYHGGLGLKHPWLHMQVRNLGREWSFEVGVVDRAGREGVVRYSTFQVRTFCPCFAAEEHASLIECPFRSRCLLFYFLTFGTHARLPSARFL